MSKQPLHKAALYIDGNNWFHSLREAGVVDRMELDYTRVSQKLVGNREWVATKYYIGQVRQQGNPALYASQRRFLAQLEGQDRRIKVLRGRIEGHPEINKCAEELLRYLHEEAPAMDRVVFHRLEALARTHRVTEVMTEKAVDVHLATDLIMDAHAGVYDDAYVLSADGDFTPAVTAVRTLGKRILSASPARGAQLAAAVDVSIPLNRDWFNDCYMPRGR